MGRRNATVIDDDVLDVVEGLLDDKPVRKNGGQRPDTRGEVRVTYILPVDVRDTLKKVAETEDVPLKEIVRYALEDFLRRYDAGSLELKKRPRALGLTLF